jgi:hypothetical protein
MFARSIKVLIFLSMVSMLVGCYEPTAETKNSREVQRQQEQYNITQPVPKFDWSQERDIVIQLYNLRNQRAVTHSVWRSDFGTIEGDCPSVGYGIPYDTSLTNPLMVTAQAQDRELRSESLATVEQAEPNGLFASKNTSATWVMCVGENGEYDPIYIEGKVTTYPYPVDVNYENNRVKKAGTSTATIKNNFVTGASIQ